VGGGEDPHDPGRPQGHPHPGGRRHQGQRHLDFSAFAGHAGRQGRLDDISHRGMEIVEQIVTIFENYGFETEIIVASVRSPLHVLEGALAGADIATIPYGVLLQLMKHPLTDAGLKKFLEDWEKARK
jgi:TalC/MipB family fructose-6-phosphate aldolase